MNVAGIDVSTRAIDIVKLPFDGARAKWHRVPLSGSSSGIERGATAAEHIPIGSWWDDVALVAIERPYGPGGDTLFGLHLVVGAIAAKLPYRLQPPWFLHPSEWRKACGISGRATKTEVRDFVYAQFSPLAPLELHAYTQDACDAYCIAYAARTINEKGAAA